MTWEQAVVRKWQGKTESPDDPHQYVKVSPMVDIDH